MTKKNEEQRGWNCEVCGVFVPHVCGPIGKLCKNPDCRNAKNREHYANDPEYRAMVYRRNRERVLDNPEETRAYMREYRKKNGRKEDPKKRKAQKDRHSAKYRVELAKKQRDRKKKLVKEIGREAALEQEREERRAWPPERVAKAKKRAQRWRKDNPDKARKNQAKKEKSDRDLPAPNDGKPWTAEDDRTVVRNDIKLYTIATILGRTVDSVTTRRCVLKRHGGSPPPKIARPVYPPTCTVKWCDRKHHSLGMCEMHYQRWRAHGTTELPSRDRPCIVDGCGEGARGDHGMCNKHRIRVKRHGSTELPVRDHQCTVEGCDRKRYGHGLCNLHYQRVQAYGTTELPVRDRRCTVEGCDRKYKARGMCNMHYQRWEKRGAA